MFGIDNITNNNGWAMAVVGATTVFLGLIILSFAISQIHKILELWENRGKCLYTFTWRRVGYVGPDRIQASHENGCNILGYRR